MRYYSKSWLRLRLKQIEQMMKRVKPIPKSKRLWNGNLLNGKARQWSVK